MSLHNYVVCHNYIDLLLILYKTSAAILVTRTALCTFGLLLPSHFCIRLCGRNQTVLNPLNVTDVVLKANCLALT